MTRPSFPVEVWMCGTIYVAANDKDEAATLVAEHYAGTLTAPFGLELPKDVRLAVGVEGQEQDELSAAITLYGVASEAVLLPANDPVRDTAPEMLEALKALLLLPVNKSWSPAETGAREAGERVVRSVEGDRWREGTAEGR